MPTSFKPCKTCELRGAAQDGSPACIKFKVLIDNIEERGCAWHRTQGSSYKCELCGQAAQNIIIYQTDERELALCSNCYDALGTCNTCFYANDCGFRNDHSEPAFVNQVTQQGFMRMQTQVKNPNLVEKHCVNCRCSMDNKGTCCKEDNNGTLCGHWMLIS